VELEQSLPEIRKRGLGLAAISYDSPAILKDFADRKHITFPMLSDPESKIIRSYGILNETVPKGAFYGVPYPGTYLVDSRGVVVSKFFEDDYTERYTASDILIKQFGAAAGAAHSTVDAKHLSLSASAGVGTVHSGQRIVLALDVELKPGIHVYAPGVNGYIPIDLAIADSAEVKSHPAVYPPSKMLHLPAIDETVPVYTGQIRVIREITIGKSVKPGDLTIDGSFRYQACDDKKCYIPETVPLKWTLKVEPHDRQRAPDDIRHK
jgi:AhpC/TSA family/Disulphide bond corrector protein DsbC